MKILVISDIHGSKYYAKKISEIDKREKPDKIILLGDLYYHGPRNSLSKEYDPMEVSKVLNSLKDKIQCVRGNCDAEVDEKISEFDFDDFINFNLNNINFFFTHGHRYNENNIPYGVDVLVYGHLHVGFIKEKDDAILANPGSIALPRDGAPNSYLIITDESILLKGVEGNILTGISLLNRGDNSSDKNL